MCPNELEKKLDLISKRLDNPVYCSRFFSDYDFAKKEASLSGLELDDDLYSELHDIYQILNRGTLGAHPAFDEWSVYQHKSSRNGASRKGMHLLRVFSSKIVKTIKSITSLLHPELIIKFCSRYTAGEILAEQLKKPLMKYCNLIPVTIGIAKGGVPLADIISKKLDSEFGFIIVRRIRSEEDPTTTIGALTEDNFFYFDPRLRSSFSISESLEKYIISTREQFLKSKLIRLRQTIAFPNVRGKLVVLVDDGSNSGATMLAAIRSLKSKSPANLIVALPIAPKGTVELLKKEISADFIVINTIRDSDFKNVSEYYKNDTILTDDRTSQIIKNRGKNVENSP